MIFVVLGTHELPFYRLLNEVERCKKNGTIKDDVIVQHGHTPFKSEVMELRKFLSYDEMEQMYDRAHLIITHGGTGSIVSGLKKRKKVVAAARLKKYGEHNDDHQLEIIEQFVNAHYILSWDEDTALETVIEKAQSFEPRPFVSGKEKIIGILRDFISKI